MGSCNCPIRREGVVLFVMRVGGELAGKNGCRRTAERVKLVPREWDARAGRKTAEDLLRKVDGEKESERVRRGRSFSTVRPERPGVAPKEIWLFLAGQLEMRTLTARPIALLKRWR